MGQASGVSIAQAPRGGRGDGRGRRRGGSKGRDRIEGGKCMRVEVKKKKKFIDKNRGDESACELKTRGVKWL